MGAFGSSHRRKDEGRVQRDSETANEASLRKKPRSLFSSIGVQQLLSSRIPDAFLVHETKSFEFVDEDGDVANEFYLEVRKEGEGRRLRRKVDNLTPQKAERYCIPRLHPDLPVVMVQVHS